MYAHLALTLSPLTVQGVDEEDIEDAEDLEHSEAQTYQLSIYAIFGFIISYIHPSTATVLFKTFDCTSVLDRVGSAADSWLQMDVSEQCFTSLYFGGAT